MQPVRAKNLNDCLLNELIFKSELDISQTCHSLHIPTIYYQFRICCKGMGALRTY